MVLPLKNLRTDQKIMQTHHTPGPYKAIKGSEDEEDRWIIVADNGTKPYHIATVENGQPGDSLETEEATAHMLAASHETLHALQILLGCVLMGGDPREGIEGKPGTSPVAIARAAVTKACRVPGQNVPAKPCRAVD